MAIVVREAIQYYDAFIRPPQYEIFVVVGRILQVMTDEAVAGFVQALNVLDSPRRP